MVAKKVAALGRKIAQPEERLSLGRARAGARFTAAPPAAQLPESYTSTLEEIKRHLREARLRTVLAANTAVIAAYWQTGKIILARQQEQGWGAKVIDRLSMDLREAFPGMSGCSKRNLLSMRIFAEAFPDGPIAQQAVAQLPWGHIPLLLQMVKEPSVRATYIQETLTHGWSRGIMQMQIQRQHHLQTGKAQNNFPATLPPPDSDLASQIFKDTYLFDFVGTADARRESQVEQALGDHIQKFLLELSAGFAFVGRQVHLEVGDKDFFLDLLFYHLKLRRFVVVELKARAFTPGDVGQMNLYLSAADDLLRHPDDQPTIGLLLCKEKDRLIVEYALRGLDQSIAIAAWQTRLTETLPQELKGSLPTIAEIEEELTRDLGNMQA